MTEITKEQAKENMRYSVGMPFSRAMLRFYQDFTRIFIEEKMNILGGNKKLARIFSRENETYFEFLQETFKIVGEALDKQDKMYEDNPELLEKEKKDQEDALKRGAEIKKKIVEEMEARKKVKSSDKPLKA